MTSHGLLRWCKTMAVLVFEICSEMIAPLNCLFLYSLTSYKCDGNLFTVNIILIMTLFLINVSCDIIYHLRLFPQDQTGGLEPDGRTDYNCIYLRSGFGYHFADGSCDSATVAPLCEAPREAIREGHS